MDIVLTAFGKRVSASSSFVGRMKTGVVFVVLLFCGAVAFANQGALRYYLVLGDKASKTEMLTARQFETDLSNVTADSVMIIKSNGRLPRGGVVFLIGTVESNPVIARLAKSGSIHLSGEFPGARGGIWSIAEASGGRKVIVLGGSNVQGEQYAVFGYSHRILGVDPVAYWTGKEPRANPFFNAFSFKDRVIFPPKIHIMCYFSNDVDELANLKKPYLVYDWKTYTEMINSLVRMKYNAIQLFDMLGRPEFYRNSAHFISFYRKLRPHYSVDMKYVARMINYAHEMGMMVQIDMSLGYRFYPYITQKEDSCWSRYKGKWIAAWKYYMTKTPIGKCDIFSFRPRNQIWDWPYRSSCGENRVKVFDEAYSALNRVIDKYRPDAIKIAMIYSDGMQVYNNGLKLPKGWLAAWSGNGWGSFEEFPAGTRGYKFGTYIHAGFFLNHVVVDPYPVRIGKQMSSFVEKYNATNYMEVNGQTFRPFILNLEAYSAFAQSPSSYNGEEFYREWASYYFGKIASQDVVKAYRYLHEAQSNEVGYVRLLSDIGGLIRNLSANVGLLKNNRRAIRDLDMEIHDTNARLAALDSSWKYVAAGLASENGPVGFYHDQVELPVRLLRQLLVIKKDLAECLAADSKYVISHDRVDLKRSVEYINRAKLELNRHILTRNYGDLNPRWKGWYYTWKRRPNNGFPTLNGLGKIESRLESALLALTAQ